MAGSLSQRSARCAKTDQKSHFSGTLKTIGSRLRHIQFVGVAMSAFTPAFGIPNDGANTSVDLAPKDGFNIFR
jgi:hypothetical protein